MIIKDITTVMNNIGQLARDSAKKLAQCSGQMKNLAIELIASELKENSEVILEAFSKMGPQICHQIKRHVCYCYL